MTKPEKLDNVHTRIYRIRGKQMMLDSDLADLYEVKTFNLNKAVRRNIKRFPPDFMCQLSQVEHQNLIFQIGISSSWGGRRHRPYAFTQVSQRCDHARLREITTCIVKQSRLVA